MALEKPPPEAEAALQEDPQAVAGTAGLTYVSGDEPGYSRRRRGRGFTYLDPGGSPVKDPQLRSRFEALVIPPAWTGVWICTDEQGHIQATGRDEKGRKQYIYHPRWAEARSETKFNRLIPFARALPAIREQVEADLQLRGLPRRRVTALVVRLLDATLIRIGNREYVRQNSSYGLTTLQDEHFELRGARLVFNFRGKRGLEHSIELAERRLARLVRRCQELPGQQLFQYLPGNGEPPQSIGSGDVNAYLREVSGQEFSAKDFRTWGGAVLAAVELYALGPAASEREAKKNITRAVQAVAKTLGNTPAVCRKYYIHPSILQAYLDGSLFGAVQAALSGGNGSDPALDPPETAVLDLLQR